MIKRYTNLHSTFTLLSYSLLLAPDRFTTCHVFFLEENADDAITSCVNILRLIVLFVDYSSIMELTSVLSCCGNSVMYTYVN